jgi:hypothetical protein
LRQEIELHLFLIPYMFARMRERERQPSKV